MANETKTALELAEEKLGHEIELCHVEPCRECAAVFDEEERIKKARKTCGGCGRPWAEHKTSEVDVCLHLMRRAEGR